MSAAASPSPSSSSSSSSPSRAGMGAEERDAVRVYELQENVLLRAVQPGGILYYSVERGPLEALLVPRQHALRRYGLTAFLELGASAPPSASAAPPVVDTPLTQTADAPVSDAATHGAVATAAAAAAAKEQQQQQAQQQLQHALRHINADQHRAIAAALRVFLAYHLVHFDTTNNSRFTTAKGQRGEFSEALDRVKRYGRLGSVAVVADAGPLRPAEDPSVENFHPSKLQLFFLRRPLMDKDELQTLRTQLQDIVIGRHVVPRVVTSHTAAAAAASVTHKTGSEGLPAVLPYAISPRQASPGAPLSTTSAMAGAASSLASSVCAEEEGSDAERRSHRQAHAEEDSSKDKSNRRGRTSGAEEGAATAAAHSALPGAEEGGGSLTESEDVVVEEADFTPYVTKTRHQRERRLHKNITTHEYSKESIRNYRRVVAADNEVHYDEFEKLMERPTCATLVRLVSFFVVNAQEQQTVFLDHHRMTRLMHRCLEEMQRMRFDERTTTVLAEGIEKYVTTKLYFKMFNVNPQEAKIDALLQEKLQRVEDLTAAQLDALPEVEYKYMWGQAMFELDGMNFFKTPREKLRCGIRACELLSLAVRDVLTARRSNSSNAAKDKAAGESRDERSSARGTSDTSAHEATPVFGADEFVPCFMLLVLRAKPYNLYQNVMYIDNFRATALRSPEENYCLATLLSAIEFWLNCNDEGQIVSRHDTEAAAAPPPPPQPPAAGNTDDTNAAAAASSSAAAAVPAQEPATRNRSPAVTPPASRTRPAAPVLHEEDLLPSVRHASATARPVRTAQQVTNVIMDALFGPATSATRSSTAETGAHPHSDLSASAANTSTSAAAVATTSAGSSSAAEMVHSLDKRASATGAPTDTHVPSEQAVTTTTGGAAQGKSGGSGAAAATTTASSTSANNTNNTSTGSGYSFDLLGFFTHGSSRPMATRRAAAAANATSASSVARAARTSAQAPVAHRLLVEEKKSFDELTVHELRAIVEEARRLSS